MISPAASRRIVIVQYGDYAEAFRRFSSGGSENYYAQKYTVDYVAGLASRYGSATVLTFSRDHGFEKLPNGVGVRGVLLYPAGGKSRHEELARAVQDLDPTDLVVVAPLRPLLRWALSRPFLRALPLFADSFRAPGLANKLRHLQLRRLLNRPEIRWVANHSIAASLDLARIGVRPDKVLPFDWPPVVSPASYPPRTPPEGGPFRLLYVGLLTETKGVGDVLRAMPRLPSCTLTVVGGGGNDETALRALPGANGTSSRVTFRGKIPHDGVLEEMRTHHAVLVPSRPEYPEGLPMTIYEAFCTRAPVIASDHPMFLKRIVAGSNALVFPAGDSAALAAAVERLRSDPGLYRSLSVNAGEAAERYLLPLKWHHLLDLWLQDSPEADARLASFSLAKRAYA